MKKICLCCLALLCLTNLFAQETVNYKEKKPYKTWVKMAPKLNDEFFKTPEAIRIGDNVLLYQQTTGGLASDFETHIDSRWNNSKTLYLTQQGYSGPSKDKKSHISLP